jgi:ketosteroid isomerase-like protein
MRCPRNATAWLALLLLAGGCSDKQKPEKVEIAKVADEPVPEAEPEPVDTALQAATASTEATLANYLDAFKSRDLDTLLANYSEDSVFLTPMGTASESEGLEGVFKPRFEELAKPGAELRFERKFVHGEVGFITWSAETPDNTYVLAADTFVVKSSKIVAHTFAAKVVSKTGATRPRPKEVELPKGETRDVLNHHLSSFGHGDLEAVLSDYTEDSTLITPHGQINGLQSLREFFEGLTKEFRKPGMKFKLNYRAVAGDVAFVVWEAETADNTYELATDTFVVRKGKIAQQTFAAKVKAKN